MTRQQRTRIVELLRCAADLTGHASPFGAVIERLRPPQSIAVAAGSAWQSVFDWALAENRYGRWLESGAFYVSMHSTLLEAAVRVEEGVLL